MSSIGWKAGHVTGHGSSNRVCCCSDLLVCAEYYLGARSYCLVYMYTGIVNVCTTIAKCCVRIVHIPTGQSILSNIFFSIKTFLIITTTLNCFDFRLFRWLAYHWTILIQVEIRNLEMRIILRKDWPYLQYTHTVVCSSICATDISLMDWPVPPPYAPLVAPTVASTLLLWLALISPCLLSTLRV